MRQLPRAPAQAKALKVDHAPAAEGYRVLTETPLDARGTVARTVLQVRAHAETSAQGTILLSQCSEALRYVLLLPQEKQPELRSLDHQKHF